MHLVCLFSFILFLSFSNLICSDVYIVMVDSESKPSVFSTVEHWYEATLQTLHDENTDDHHQQTNQLITHVYNTVSIGFSALLTEQQAAQLANKTCVTAVMLDSVLQLHTTRSPSFLGLYSTNDNNNNNNNNNVPGRLLSMSDSGSDVIIGVIDTGIWPEHPSFSDEDMGPIPSRWKGPCGKGQNFTASDGCNRKLIGARYFYKGYEEANGKINSSNEFLSARDSNGHGTHAASTAAGRPVAGASLVGYAEGTAVGVAPNARIAAYKVCWENGICMVSDILSAIDKAVEDGVDVISLSVGGLRMSNVDPIAIGAFGAMKMGVFVSAAAGNEGPGGSSVINVAPWMTTVGAGTIDRSFEADLVLGDGQLLKGSWLFYSGKPLPNIWKMLSIVYGEFCESLDAEIAGGRIVVCIGNVDHVYRQVAAVKRAGGVAIVVSDMGMHGQTLRSYLHSIPGVTLTIPSLQTTLDYWEHFIPEATATIVFHGTELGIKPAPIVASFSSRGPNYVSPFLMKPDMIAPGVNILAAWPYNKFNIVSGTSVSCSHISGVAALLKGAHTDWSPAMIRSAMMTTAYTIDKQGQPILDDNDYTNATVWAMGAGHVDPEKAVDPGLVYDISPDDYLNNFLCGSGYSAERIKSVTGKDCGRDQSAQPWNLNYPAIVVDFNAYDRNVIVVKRTATHVTSNYTATYTVKVVNPKGARVSVTPTQMKFNKKGEKLSYAVLIEACKLTLGPGESTTDVGEIVWSDGNRNVVSPVVMVWKKDY